MTITKTIITTIMARTTTTITTMTTKQKKMKKKTEKRRWSYQRAQSRETTPILGIHFNFNDLLIISGWPK